MLITRVWKSQPGKYFCVSTKDRHKKWRDHFFRRGQMREVKKFIDENQDKDLYWCPHGFRKPRRIKEAAEIPKLLWADLDEADPRELNELMPSIAWESSPGRFVGLWIIDKFMTEDLNRRLTHATQADPGGWDLTQVLRIPNTTNYKYHSTPRVRLLWSDGPVYKVRDIEKLLPTEAKASDYQKDVVAQIYNKYEKSFNGFVRRNLIRGKPQRGKRSEVLWRLVNEIIEAGCTKEEAFELLRASPWNKFANRRNGDERLQLEIEKALSGHFRVIDDEYGTDEEVRQPQDFEDDEEEHEEYKFLQRSMAEVEEEKIDWVWYPYVARGELTILEGDPGLGKSYLAQMVSAAICDGKKLPSVKSNVKTVQGKVAYFDIENASGSVTKKRLKMNGLQHEENFFQEEEPFSVDDEDILEDVYDAIEQLRPTLVVFDTVNTYIGKADTHKSAETQQAFKRFVEIARRFNCAVIVLRHLTKSSKERALYRGQGSIAFTGLARVVLTVGTLPEELKEDDEDETRVLAVTKLNVTKPPKALTFSIQALPDTMRETDRSRFIWGDFVSLSSEEIIAAPTGKQGRKGPSKLDEAKEFLEGYLNGEAVKFADVLRAGEARSFSRRILQRAADELGVKRRKRTWSLAPRT